MDPASTIEHVVPARVGLLGNPSDGYGGRTLAVTVPSMAATVTLTPGDRGSGIEIVPAADERGRWANSHALADHVDRYGLGTGSDVLIATVRTFLDVCRSLGRPGPEDLSLGYDSTIPRQVGLAGSSALAIATLRCLADHVRLDWPDEVVASVALSVEVEQLGITAGLQDRVVQSIGGLVAMDFSTMTVNPDFGVSHGRYESLDRQLLPPVFLAYAEDLAEPSGRYHGDLRARFEAGDARVRTTLRALAALVPRGVASLRWRDHETFAELVGRNMELRRELGPLPQAQLRLIDLADSLEAPATFAGSGGAVVGVARDEAHLTRLRGGFESLDAKLVAISS